VLDGLVRVGVWLVIGGIAALFAIEAFGSSSPSSESGVQTALVVGQPVDPENDSAAAYAPEPQPEIGRSQRARDAAADQLGYYPPAPSKAGGMTPAWREYAATIDRVCAATYNYALGQLARADRRAELRNWRTARIEAAQNEIWSQQGPRIQLAARRLGAPPRRAGLFQRWLANVMTRSALFSRASHAATQAEWQRYSEICDRIGRLKDESDRLGQRFGLRVCTSN
jgi:hypothetical protein